MKYIALLLCFLLVACAGGGGGKPRDYKAPTPSKGMFKVGKPYKIKGVTYYPQEKYDYVETGIASWYGPGFHGKSTANGERFDTRELTAAHKTLQMPSLVRVTNLENGKSVVVRVNDRGPYVPGRIIDVSERAADLLAFKGKGVAKVRLEVLSQESIRLAEMAKSGQSTKGSEMAYQKTPVSRRTTVASIPAQPVPSPASTLYPDVPPPGVIADATPHVQQTVMYDAAGNAPPAPLAPLDIPAVHSKGGALYPDPVVTQRPVGASKIYIQAGSFSSSANANQLAGRLTAYGNTQVVPGVSNGTTYYRVRVGPYASAQTADATVLRMAQQGHRDAMIVVEESAPTL